MRHNTTTWMGIAALGVLQYMGPRPLFVRTAYAVAPVAFAVAADDLAPLGGAGQVAVDELAGLEMADAEQTPACVLSSGSMLPNGN